MKKLIAACLTLLLATAFQTVRAADAAPAAASKPAAATAGGSCEDKAVGKDGKKLAGAAKATFMKKCEGAAAPAADDAKSGCEAKAVSKTGKKLAGAAKNAFMKKCEADSKK